MLKNKFIICYSGTNWELPWGMSQKIMNSLSRQNRIIFIEYQPSFLHCFLKGSSYITYDNRDRGRLKKIDDNLSTYRPRIGSPFNNYFRFVNILNQRRIYEDIKPEIDKYDSKDVILWIFVPYAVDFVNRLEKFFTVYHCAGNYSVEKSVFLRKRTVSKMERALVDESDIVIAQTRSLCKKFDKFNKKTFYLPSVVDAKNFYIDTTNKRSIEFELKNIKYPRIGIIGYFDDDFYDVDLLKYLLDKKQDWSFVFLGPITGKSKKFKQLKSRNNAFFLGKKEQSDISSYINAMSIGIIPYKVNPYMKEVSPNKFYEYIACGKGVVSSDLPDIKNYTDVSKIARNKKDFLVHIEELLAKDKKGLIGEKALKIAKENYLEKYLKNLSETIEHMINKKS